MFESQHQELKFHLMSLEWRRNLELTKMRNHGNPDVNWVYFKTLMTHESRSRAKHFKVIPNSLELGIIILQ